MSEHRAACISPMDGATSSVPLVLENDQLSSCNCSRVVTKTAPTTPLSCPKEIETLLQREANYTPKSSKRNNYIGWDDYFLATAALSAHRSKDPVNATGACLVDTSNRIIGTGYNGFPRSASDDLLPWTNRSGNNILHTKAPYEVHAEVNAILNKCAPDCVGARLYTREFPCNECAKILIQSGISEVVYCKEPEDSPSLRASRILLNLAGIKLRQCLPALSHLTLDFGVSAEQDSPDPIATTTQATVDPIERDLLVREANYDPDVWGSTKRSNYLSWDDYFLGDPNTQVGACIVDPNKRIVGLGYNGFPSGCNDDTLPWARTGDPLHTKYPYVCHAEVNAILNKGSADVKNSTMYVALFPCNECAKIIIQAGIKEVVYLSDRYHDTDGCRASRILFHLAGVRVRLHTPRLQTIVVNLTADSNTPVGF